MKHHFNQPKPTSYERSELLPYISEQLGFVAPMMHRVTTESCRAVGLRTPRDLMLLVLLTHHAITQAQVAKMFEINAPTLSKQIDALVADGFIERTPSATDRRAQVLSITRKGKDVLKKAKTESQRRVSEMLSETSDDELVTLYEASEILTRVMRKRTEAFPHPHHGAHCQRTAQYDESRESGDGDE